MVSIFSDVFNSMRWYRQPKYYFHSLIGQLYSTFDSLHDDITGDKISMIIRNCVNC